MKAGVDNGTRIINQTDLFKPWTYERFMGQD